MPEKLRITVMLGGPSAEREVSLRSGAAVAQALRSLGHDVFELDPQPEGWDLPACDVVFLALHGTYGEDGTVQRKLEELGMPYTGCDSEASAVAFDKFITKERCVAAGVPTARFLLIDSVSASWPMGWNPPIVLKPVRQGSSVGLHFVERVSDWSPALLESMRYDSQVLMEEKIIGRETTVGILAGQPLPVVEVRPRTGVYDYRSKYTSGATEYLCPAPFDEATTQRIQAAGLGAFQAVGGRDYGRIDIMVRADGEPVVLEVNTLPGMTETSLLPKAAAAAGIGYAELCQRMVDLALQHPRGILSS
ncbi:MAG TPA: D-alanine--D-alanine ligase [Candidatus Limnocylindrales bacterium]|jgi:D-alanine-D-alanine ligase|nr:D-alanine--D-alanine ligase [Candidatus Limnocylindrales bacterium]